MSMKDEQELIEIATEARDRAIARYSKFCVGVALEAEDGTVYTGCNVESAVFELTMCAERIAIFKALSEGTHEFSRIAVVADTERLTPPCGGCRQLIWEFCGDVPVILANLRGKSSVMHMRDLLPGAFDASFFKISDGE